MNRQASRGACAVALLLTAVVGLGAPLGVASATMITEVSASYTVGATGATEIEAFTVAGPGAAEVTLTDLLWPQALAGLSFELTNAAGQVLGSLSGAGTATFDLAAGGTYFALSFGQASSPPSPACPFGSYGVTIAYTPTAVPLPGTALLLLSGLALVSALGLARSRGGLAVRAPGLAVAAAINV